MFIYVPLEARRCSGVAEMQQGDTARIKVWRMLEENLILEWLLSVHAAAAASALHESTVNYTSGRYQALRRLLFHDGAFPFLSVLFLSDLWPSFSCLFISVLSGSFSCSASLSCRIKQVNNKLFFLSHFWIFLFLVSQKQFSQLPSPLLLSSADPVHTNLQSEAERLWSRTTASGAPWCGPSGAPLQWGWCLIKPPASTPSMPVLPWPPPSVGAVEVHRTHTLYYKLPVLELPLFFTAVCV